jgi:dTDP-glucose 4,6-dehydratase
MELTSTEYSNTLEGKMADWSFDQDIDFILESTDDVWPALRGARLFITGGTGFIGC